MVLRLVWPDEVTDPETLERYRASLTDAEQRRISKFVFEKDRHVRLLARGALRAALAEFTGAVEPSAFRFACNEFGKPFVDLPAHAAGIRFNLSHCDGLIAIQIEDGVEVGVDVERIRPMEHLMQLAGRFFAQPEVEELRLIPEVDRRDRFFQYWTLKESYIKARGLGLSLGLDRFWFELRHGIRIHFAKGFDDDPARWVFHQQRVGPLHWLASTVERHS